jgi:large subunit ribosomal protein L24
MLLCPSCNRPTRVGHRFTTENGEQKKQRVCKRCGEAIPTPTVNR